MSRSGPLPRASKRPASAWHPRVATRQEGCDLYRLQQRQRLLRQALPPPPRVRWACLAEALR